MSASGTKRTCSTALTNVRFWGQSGHGPTAAYQSRFMSTAALGKGSASAPALCRKRSYPLRHKEKDIGFGTWLEPKNAEAGRRKNERLRDAPAPLIGYMRVSKADGSQVLDLQRDALLAAGVSERHLYSDTASGKKDDRPGLAACLQALREGDTLVVWKLDRLGRSLRHLVNVVHDLTSRGIGLRVLTGQGAAIDTTTPAGKLVFGIFASLAEFERDLF